MEEERRLAETTVTEEALAAMPQVAAQLGMDFQVVDRPRREYEEHLQVLRANRDGLEDDTTLRYERDYTALRLALLARKRATLFRPVTSAGSTTLCSGRC